ncbi:hypothetical protein CJP72_15455 [Citrobacter sp. NCU1]|uniref:hypothetical protein n=1 Tax=Citrobacter sp. NCU1 TaxID=2026683 RepID=UPI001390D97A|nr:hypothetical protein [Citrobacter sp. NCU1]NDO82109.1 hypothetical protein [Citrobacter sp. NCU1]
MKTKLNSKFLTVSYETGAIWSLDELIACKDAYANITQELKTAIKHGHKHMTIDFDDVCIADEYGYLCDISGSRVDETLQREYLKRILIQKLDNGDYSSSEIHVMMYAAEEHKTSMLRDEKREQSRKDRGHDYSLEERKEVLLKVVKALDERKLPVVNAGSDKEDEFCIALDTPKTISVARKRARAIIKDVLGIDLPSRKAWDSWREFQKNAFFKQLEPINTVVM